MIGHGCSPCAVRGLPRYKTQEGREAGAQVSVEQGCVQNPGLLRRVRVSLVTNTGQMAAPRDRRSGPSPRSINVAKAWRNFGRTRDR